MIVSVRRWTSITLPRIARRAKLNRSNEPKVSLEQEKPAGFLESYNRMFEHQVGLMFKEDLKN